MNIDDIIGEGRFFAWCVFPEEFDGTRSPLFFECKASSFQSANGEIFTAAPFSTGTNNTPQRETLQSEHFNTVEAALKSILSGDMEKVVVSCIKHVARNSQSLQSIFERLKERYTNAFVYVMHHPTHGIWMGATPELLLHKQGTRYHTVSLAGTQPYQQAVQWTEKLQREQQLVTDFITASISLCDGKDIKLNGPYTSQAGPLAHLKTDVYFTAEASSDIILNELQPTPAVCGLPRETARTFIQMHASFERRLYAGRLGIHFSSGDEIHFVNLRCMQVFNDHFELHVGGGIVAGSNATEEWQETEIKADVLRSLLR